MTVDIANRLVQLRKEHHLSQEELAEQIGLSRQAVSKWERAEASPDTDNLILLSRLYGVSIDELLRTDAADEEVKRQEAQSAPETEAEKRQRVHIGFKGIHVEDGEDYVHVGWDGIRVSEKNGDKVEFAKNNLMVNGQPVDYKKHILRRVPIAVIVTIAYLVIGFQWGLWHPGWLLFLLIPIFESTVTAIERRDPSKFAYPVLASLVFLCLGLFWGAWHPGWAVFLTIPLYYATFPVRSQDGEVSFGGVPDDLKDEFNAALQEKKWAEEENAAARADRENRD